MFNMFADPRLYAMAEGGRNRNEAELPRASRIASFLARVEDVEEMQKDLRTGRGGMVLQTYSDVRKRDSKSLKLSELTIISASALEPNRIHKRKVLFCRVVVRCMVMNSLATLVEADGQILNLQLYKAHGVKTIWEGQAWLPEGSTIATVEPFYKIRTDGTLGIRVDNPKDVIFNVTPADACKPMRSIPEAASVVQPTVAERLTAFADTGVESKQIRKCLRQEGFEISEKVTRRLLKEYKEESAAQRTTANIGKSDNACGDAVPAEAASVAAGSSSATSKSQHVIGSKLDECRKTAAALIGDVPVIGTRVYVQGLKSDSGMQLNGQEGVIVGQDLLKSRALVNLGAMGEKAIKFGNLKLVDSSAMQLPIPCPTGVGTCLSEVISEERWIEAVVFGQCRDSAFLSHGMPLDLVQKMRGSVPHCLVVVVEAIVAAHSRKQYVSSSAGPDEMDSPSTVLSLCDASVHFAFDEGPSGLSHSLALFLRGCVHICMVDWQAAASDYQAAYVASRGQLPWILTMAGWCTVSGTDGLPLAKVQENDALSQQEYEIFLHYLNQVDLCGSESLKSMHVVALWELAFVCQMRGSRLHPMVQMLTRPAYSEGPVAQTSEGEAQKLYQKAVDLKDQALAAEAHLASGGIMNCLARESVLRNSLVLGKRSTKEGAKHTSGNNAAKSSADCAKPGSDETDSTNENQSRRSAHQRMQAEEIERMDKEQDARDAGDMASMLLLRAQEQMLFSKRFEEGVRNRRHDIEVRTQALQAHEAALRRRETQMAEQHANFVGEAAKLEGDKDALDKLYKREKQRQAEEFKAQLAHSSKQYEDEITSAQSQLQETLRQREEEHSALLEGKRLAEKALAEVVGVKEAEVDRWQQEIRDQEDQISSEQVSLKLQSEQLAKMQVDLAEKGRVLEERDRGLKVERKAQKELQTDGKLSQEMLGAQTSGRRKMNLHVIRFSQDSISSVFSDGRSTEQLTKDLKSGKQSIADFPTIRVVEFAHRVWSLDNRRLRCMQTAFAKDKWKTIDVQVESLKQEKVKTEFDRKFTAGSQIVQRWR